MVKERGLNMISQKRKLKKLAERNWPDRELKRELENDPQVQRYQKRLQNASPEEAKQIQAEMNDYINKNFELMKEARQVHPGIMREQNRIKQKQKNIERAAPVGGALLGAVGGGALAPKTRRGAAIGGLLGGAAGKLTSPLLSEKATGDERVRLMNAAEALHNRGQLFRG